MNIVYENDFGVHEEELDPRTRRVNLADRDIHTISLEPLGNLENLQMLDLSRNRLSDVDFSPLRNCKRFEGLSLDYNQISEIDLDPFKDIETLKALAIGHNLLSELDLTPLKNKRLLEVLYIGRNHLHEIDLSPLETTTDLRQLLLNNNAFTEVDLSALQYTHNLELLLVGSFNLFDEGTDIVETSLLEAVYLKYNRLKTIDLEPISGCGELEVLDLRGNRIKEINLSHLQYLRSLVEVNLDRTIKICWEGSLPMKEMLPTGLQKYYEALEKYVLKQSKRNKSTT